MKRNGDWRFHLLRESLREENPQREAADVLRRGSKLRIRLILTLPLCVAAIGLAATLGWVFGRL